MGVLPACRAINIAAACLRRLSSANASMGILHATITNITYSIVSMCYKDSSNKKQFNRNFAPCYGTMSCMLRHAHRKKCAPCYNCGNLDTELEDFARGIHTYTVYEIYDGIRLTLCDFCAVDIASYAPEFWGLPDRRRISISDLTAFSLTRGISDPTVHSRGDGLTGCHFSAVNRPTDRPSP